MKEKKGLASLCSSQIFKSDWKTLLHSEEGALFCLLTAILNYNFVMKISSLNCQSNSKFRGRVLLFMKVPACFYGVLSTARTRSTSQRVPAMGFSAQPARYPCVLGRGGQGGNAPGELWAEVLSFGDKLGIWDLRRKPVPLTALWQSTKEHVSFAQNREVGSHQNHQTFPLRAGVLLALSFLPLN